MFWMLLADGGGKDVAMDLFGDLLSLPFRVAGNTLTAAGNAVKATVKPGEQMVEDVKETLEK